MITQSKARQKKIDAIVEFCAGGKTSDEISAALQISKSSIFNLLAGLQHEGRLFKVTPEVRYFKGMGPVHCYFVATGTACDRAPMVVKNKPEPEPDPNSKINHEFIAVMHRVLVLGAV